MDAANWSQQLSESEFGSKISTGETPKTMSENGCRTD